MLESPTNQPQPYGTWHATEEIHRCQERIRIPHQTWDEESNEKNINNWWIGHLQTKIVQTRSHTLPETNIAPKNGGFQ